jgi:glycosyltransferase involved in cell wall biosynthesis
MNRSVTCYILSPGIPEARILEHFRDHDPVDRIYTITTTPDAHNPERGILRTEHLMGSGTIRLIADTTRTPFVMICLTDQPVEMGQYALERFSTIIKSTRAGMVYSDYYEIKNEVRSPHPTMDYQPGSVRDDFNFGPLLFYPAHVITEASKRFENNFSFAGFYDLRLKTAENHPVIRIPEFLYSVVIPDSTGKQEKLFDYVDPGNREIQKEMETAFTTYLKNINACLQTECMEADLQEMAFGIEASVIIPVKNRVRTIESAIQSVLKQKTDFSFNLIVIDNHSSDGTTEKIRSLAQNDEKIIHLIPSRKDLGIGGCWNEGIDHERCGKFAVQLDSDDVYESESTLKKIVETFYREKCAMVIGSYKTTNFDFETIPPGIIDHSEWTPENGRNNALRINGLGAPRAFYTPIIRKTRFPNVSYGEDYAVGLHISRNYRIGRIYESIYLCRRWEDNTDATLPVEKRNANNAYKDWIRTVEIKTRQQMKELKKKKKQGFSGWILTILLISILVCNQCITYTTWQKHKAEYGSLNIEENELKEMTLYNQAHGKSDPVLYHSKDKQICTAILKNAAKQELSDKPLNEIVVEVARSFLGTEYVGHTLETSGEEKLVINLRGLDCTTLLENVVVLSRLIKQEKTSFEEYAQELIAIRYRDGKLDKYSSRLHYFSDWLYNNGEKGIVTDITKDLGGKPYDKKINFMTENRDKYRQLGSDDFFNEMERVERELATHDFYYIPQSEVEENEDKVQNGDLIAITSTVEGLDIAHVTIALHQNKRLHIIHASSSLDKVVISEDPLAEYLKKNKLQDGIMIGRLVE